MIDLSQLITAEDKLAQRSATVRADRDERLQASDWTQLPDSPLLGDSGWLAYRQALRDVPEQSGFPDVIAWPDPPQ